MVVTMQNVTCPLQEYIGQLGCGAVRGLARRYWADLELFQYNMASMLAWAEGGRGCQH